VLEKTFCALLVTACEEKNRAVVQELAKAVKIHPKSTSVNPIEDQLNPLQVGAKDPSIVFTGSLAQMTRTEAEAVARRLGFKPVKTVSKSTDIVVVGQKAGGKSEKAKQLGLKIILEEEWYAMCLKDSAEPPITSP